MKLGLSIPPTVYAHVILEARERGITSSRVMREILAREYAVAPGLPRRISYKEPAEIISLAKGNSTHA